MRKAVFVLVMMLIVSLLLSACGSYTMQEGKDGVIHTYSYDSVKNLYTCDGIDYSYKLTLSGTIPNAALDSEYVLLSNVNDITFEQAYKSIISSNSADFFDQNETVLVEMRTVTAAD